MKILFLVGATSRIRNFHHTIIRLAEHGHQVTLAGRLRKGAFELPKTVVHPRVAGRVNPTQRSDAWRDFVDLLRGARDYVRYFDPRYAQATRLVRRAYEIAPTEFVLFCERHSWVKPNWKAVSKALAVCEDLVPSDPGFEAFVRDERPDLILVTPLVTFESYQTDYVKVAHRLGIPVVFIPFSWDNLTNKGLMRVQPDRVLVWNDTQQREAIELHGCAPDDVAITGAARFDDFFAATPATSRDEFLSEYGLDPSRPMVLYLGSSQLTGPNEMELVRRWAESIRGADDEVVRTCGILVRPHPALRTSWTSVDLSDLGNVAISLNASRNADQELFDSLSHAHAAIGLNTSAMLEAAITGVPVHTLVIPGFDEGQVGTMHFHYLVEAYGGLATIARDLNEHRTQLAGVLREERTPCARSLHFAQQFLRPLGADQPVSPILADEIERAASIVKRADRSTPIWHAPLRAALLAWLRRRAVAKHSVEDTTIIATSMSLRPVKTALEEIQQGTAPVFVGPWLDSIGDELLYWIPFVRWVAATYGLAAERLIVLSRSGVGEWYGPLATRYLDVRKLFSRAELDHWTHRSVPQREQDPKQAVIAPFDQEVVERAARAFDVSDWQVLHPLMLFRVLGRLQKDRALEQMGDVLQYERVDAALRERLPALPASFIAFSAGFTTVLPHNEDNARFLSELLAKIAAKHDVVLVDSSLPAEVEVPPSDRVHRLSSLLPDIDPLRAQIQAIAHARSFVGGYGDLAILAAFCDIPTTAYHSDRMPPDHPDRVHSASASGKWGRLTVERARRVKGVRLPAEAHA